MKIKHLSFRTQNFELPNSLLSPVLIPRVLGTYSTTLKSTRIFSTRGRTFPQTSSTIRYKMVQYTTTTKHNWRFYVIPPLLWRWCYTIVAQDGISAAVTCFWHLLVSTNRTERSQCPRPHLRYLTRRVSSETKFARNSKLQYVGIIGFVT